MSRPAAGADRRHPHPAQLLEFAERHTTRLRYLLRLVDWLRAEYPGSVDELVPQLRDVYRRKQRELPF